MSTDWPVWPIFIIQFIAVILLFFKSGETIMGFKIRAVIISLLLIGCIGIGVSLWHDSTTVLNLHF